MIWEIWSSVVNRFGWVTFAVITLSVSAAASTAAYRWHGVPNESTIAAGKLLFEHEFVPHDPLCGNGDGLGPVFNDRSCVACHFLGGIGGAGSNEQNVTAFEAFPTPGRPFVVASAVHRFATERNLLETVGLVNSLFPPIPGATRVVSGCSVRAADFDPVQLDEINTPALFGAGLIDRLSSAAITMNSARSTMQKMAREIDGDFSGRGVGRLRGTVAGGPGKFGWKGQFSSLHDFIASACAMELGLSNPDAAQGLPRAFRADNSAQLDMSRRQLYELVSFVRTLPRPEQVMPEDSLSQDRVHQGESIFSAVGCAECHVPDLGGISGIYSDFQLYEVEHENDRDAYVEPEFEPEFTLPAAHPRPSEWKTPPLWGVADSAPYFHDGGSPTLVAAITRHGRDARFARERFEKLPAEEKHCLLLFLQTLRAPLRVNVIP